MYRCEILTDSISDREHRLTSFLITYPRMIHSELLTHGMLVTNSESSRARPVKHNIRDVDSNPFIPEVFGRNKPGMAFQDILEGHEDEMARRSWRFASQDAVEAANALAELEVHKAYANRPLEPFKWHTAMFSATDWSNFFALRTHPDAQKEFQTIALMMQEQYHESEPRPLTASQWHVPFVGDEEMNAEALQWPEPFVDWKLWLPVSTGRCARLSYLTHAGKRDLEADRSLANDKLLVSGHMSPFGHQARPFSDPEWSLIHELQEYLHNIPGTYGPFEARLHRNLEYCAQYHGWWQQRANIPNEQDFSLVMADAVH